MLHVRVIRQRILRDDLKTAQARAVVQLDERKAFRVAPGPDPALDLDVCERRGGGERVFNGSGPWHAGSLPGDLASTSGKNSICDRTIPFSVCVFSCRKNVCCSGTSMGR